MNHQEFLTWLDENNACDPAQQWVAQNSYDEHAAWENCERADWMLWLAARRGCDHVQIVRATCAIARTVLHLVPDGEDRPRLAIEAAEAWCDNPCDVTAAYAAYAYAAADAAYAYAAAYAAVRAATKHADIVRKIVAYPAGAGKEMGL